MSAQTSDTAASRLNRAINMLEEEVVLGLIHPRERLVEDGLMSRFELKRHAARQALAALESMGLVERRKNVGAMVKSYTVGEVENLYAVRELLETQGARLIPLPLPTEHLDQLIAIQKRHDGAVADQNLRRVFRINVDFHQALFALSDNPVLVEAIHDHAKRAHTIRSASFAEPDLLENSRLQHWAMIEAMQAGNTEALVGLCRDHLAPSRESYIGTLRNKLAVRR